MRHEVNCLNTRMLIHYVEEVVGSSRALLENLHPEIDAVPKPRDFLCDDHNWISCSVMKELYQRAKMLTGDESVALKASFESVGRKRLGYLQELFLKAVTTPASAFKRVQAVNDKFNRTKKIELVRLSKNDAIVRLHWFRDMELTKDFCLMNQGVYKAILAVWGLPAAELEEKSCYFGGDSYCEYYVRWEPGSRKAVLKNLFLSLMPIAPHFRHAIKELEKERLLLEQKYAESHDLAISLNENVKRLAAIQEATRVVVSTPELHDVLTEVMTLMVKVTGFQRAVIMLLDEEGGELKFGGGAGADKEMLESFRDYRVPLSRMSNLMVRVVHSGVPAFIEDVNQSHLNPDNPLLKQFNPQSFFLVPVIARGKVIGALAADKGSTRAQITMDDRDCLTAFVNQIAGAIENSRLREKELKGYLRSIQSLVKALEARDNYTGGHSERVTCYSIELANLMELPHSYVELLRDVVPIHDIGKIGIPDSLLNKETPLRKHELEAIRSHTVVGAQIVAPLNLTKEGLAVVRNHHEWFDGGGYPDGLASEEIPHVARIVAITDAFDAMTTRRPYRAGMSIRSALKGLEENAGTQFDPHMVQAFSEAVKSELIKLPLNIPQL